VEGLVAETGFSRFAVVDATGDMIGYLHVKDVLDCDGEQPLPPERIRPLPTVDPDQTVSEIVTTLQRAGAHLGRVVDPRTNEVVGLIALEDALEELIGDVVDSAHTGGDT
jgi:CBS domain containing-hemolysin-like protein